MTCSATPKTGFSRRGPYIVSFWAIGDEKSILFVIHLKDQLKVIEIDVRYSKTCVKRPLKNRQNKDLNDKWLLNEGQKYCRMLPTFDLHQAIIGLENHFSVFFRVDVLHRFYCI